MEVSLTILSFVMQGFDTQVSWATMHARKEYKRMVCNHDSEGGRGAGQAAIVGTTGPAP